MKIHTPTFEKTFRAYTVAANEPYRTKAAKVATRISPPHPTPNSRPKLFPTNQTNPTNSTNSTNFTSPLHAHSPLSIAFFYPVSCRLTSEFWFILLIHYSMLDVRCSTFVLFFSPIAYRLSPQIISNQSNQSNQRN